MVKSRRGKGQRGFYIAIGAIAVVGVAALAYKSANGAASQSATIVAPPGTPAQAKPYVLGKPDAPVVVTEFADFECPACGSFATITEPDVRKRLVETGMVSYRYVDFPLPMHPNTIPASNAAACADDQNKFWEMHDALFNGQPNWSGEATRNPKSLFKGYANDVGMNVDQWEKCYDAQAHMTRVMGNKAMSEEAKIGQTPTFIIGTRKVVGALNYDRFKAYVDSAAAELKTATPVAADTAKKNKPAT